jgi:hypothetical protein
MITLMDCLGFNINSSPLYTAEHMTPLGVPSSALQGYFSCAPVGTWENVSYKRWCTSRAETTLIKHFLEFIKEV